MWNKIRKIIQDVRCGLHSGFHTCCIVYFLLVPYKKRKTNKIIHDLRLGYVICPLCQLRFNFIPEVIKCDCRNTIIPKLYKDRYEKV